MMTKKTRLARLKALADENLLRRPITESMKLYGLSYPRMNDVYREARAQILESTDPEKLNEIHRERRRSRETERLYRAARAYPLILSRIMRLGNLSAVGRLYRTAAAPTGLSRCRVFQLRNTLRLAARMNNKHPADLVAEVERDVEAERR